MESNPPISSGKNFLWYFIGSAIPMMVSLLGSPIYTRHFSPSEYGHYTLIVVSFGYLSTLLLTWISSSFWRFYPKYSPVAEKTSMLLALGYIFLVSSLVVGFVSTVLYNLYENPVLKKMIWLGALQITTNELTNLSTIPLRYDGRARLYNCINSIKAAASFAITLILVFLARQGIESFLIASIVVNCITIPLALHLTGITKCVRPGSVNRVIFREILSYGSAGIFTNVGLLLIINSDRLVIDYFFGKESVGIYNQLYNIAALSLAALFNIFFAAINPQLLRTLENNKKYKNPLTSKYYLTAFLVLVPAAVYLSMFSKELANLMLGDQFRYGTEYLPAIIFSSLLYGFTLFHEIRLKFDNKIRYVSIITISAGVFNILLNLLILPNGNFIWAALTTLVTYLLLYVALVWKDDFGIKDFKPYNGLYLRAITVLFTEFLLFLFIRHSGWITETSILSAFLEGMVYFLIYVICFYKSKKFRKFWNELSF